jgi:hypothetical protein
LLFRSLLSDSGQLGDLEAHGRNVLAVSGNVRKVLDAVMAVDNKIFSLVNELKGLDVKGIAEFFVVLEEVTDVLDDFTEPFNGIMPVFEAISDILSFIE